jgi:hypothetical protein
MLEKEKDLTKTVSEEAQTLGLVVKGSKSSVLNMLSELKETIDKKIYRKS